jgi:hypothetical protein
MLKLSTGLLTAIVISASATAQPTIPSEPQYLDPVADAVIKKLLGSDFDARDRTAVQRCAGAAVLQASVQYWPKHTNGDGINPAAQMTVTAITGVLRNENGLRVSGLIDGRAGYPLYGPVDGAAGDLNFSCNVDYRGIVSNLRITRAD